jgi:hypothetical protein
MKFFNIPINHRVPTKGGSPKNREVVHLFQFRLFSVTIENKQQGVAELQATRARDSLNAR